MTTLVELGNRYWALGLPAAARGALARAHAAADPRDAGPARRLAELALAVGDVAAARRHASEAAKRQPGAAARVLLGSAQLAAGELAAARMSFAAAIDATSATAALRARARLGLASVAEIERDGAGAAANVMAAHEDLLGAITAAATPLAQRLELIDRECALYEEVVARVVACGRSSDAEAAFVAAEAVAADAPVRLWRALLLAARIAHGERGLIDADIDTALAAEAAARPDSRVVRLRAIDRSLRRRAADPASRAAAIALLSELAGRLATEPGVEAVVEQARVWFLLATALADDPATRSQAEDAYRRGLRLRPGHAEAACRLALLILDRGDAEGALAEIERVLRIDAGYGLAWRNAARLADPSSPGLTDVVGRLLDAAAPGASGVAGSAAPRLVTAAAEVARGDVLAGVYAHGHRVKNVLGIIGSRTRSARKLADGELGERLRDLEREVMALYEEWAQYLRSMEATGPTVEVIAVAPLVHEVVAAAQARTQAVIEIHVAAAVPDLRGDRMLLREALVNLVHNAADAADKTHGNVTVSVRPIATTSAPAVEIVVADTGPGIPKAELPRIFVPGYTTKETGSGVGLTIAERVVTAHHGRILIDSEEGRGTVVIVVLPSDLGGFPGLGPLAPAGGRA
ncbi:MAG: sensor histidine kinase [Myxococcales bacterium]|nr:sensor histidine kinase [Myxococcales bacterium]